MLEHSYALISQLRAVAGRNYISAKNELGCLLNNFILALKVEGYSDKTLSTYHQRIKTFVRFADQNDFPSAVSKIDKTHIRLFLIYVRDRGTPPR
jgi:site-specific recombinase XerC